MSDPQIPLSQPTRKPILFYLIGFVSVCLTMFVLWQSYRLYQAKYQAKYPPTRPGVYACSPDGKCLLYPKQATAELCPITFQSETCDNQCDNLMNRCKSIK